MTSIKKFFANVVCGLVPRKEWRHKIRTALTREKIYYSPLNNFGNYVREGSNPVFYLKMNQSAQYSFLCLQHWINITDVLDADFWIICDKEELAHEILNRIQSQKRKIKFLRSVKKPLRNIVKNVLSRDCNIAYSHLTTFYHAKQNGIENFWNIDADDTMLLAEPSVAAKMLTEAQNYANKNSVDIFSLDMHRSRTKKQYWTFGITYTKMQMVDYFGILESYQNSDWFYNNFHPRLDAYVIDILFGFMDNNGQLKAKTFYVENSHFIHFGQELTCIAGHGVYYWKNNSLVLPIISEIYRDKKLGIIPIADDCVKFDLNIKEDDCLKFAKSYVTNFSAWLERLEYYESRTPYTFNQARRNIHAK